jgi:hypothetical protein
LSKHEARIGLKTKVLAEIQELKRELERSCPLAAAALQNAFASFQKGDPWDSFRYLGEALGIIEIYITVARQEGREPRERAFTFIKTTALTILSSARAVASQEWTKD